MYTGNSKQRVGLQFNDRSIGSRSIGRWFESGWALICFSYERNYSRLDDSCSWKEGEFQVYFKILQLKRERDVIS